MKALLRAENISKSYQDPMTVQAVDRVSVEVMPGQLIWIGGESGAGKSTLLNILGLMIHADEGKLFVQDQEIKSKDLAKTDTIRKRQIGYVFQHTNLLEALTLGENIQLMKTINPSDFLIDNYLEEFGLIKHKNHMVTALSGGQRRRSMMLMAMAKSPNILLLDEPTNDLDDHYKMIVLRTIREFTNQGKGVIMISHDPICLDYSDIHFTMKSGKLMLKEA